VWGRAAAAAKCKMQKGLFLSVFGPLPKGRIALRFHNAWSFSPSLDNPVL
jgi:hypothetical protein